MTAVIHHGPPGSYKTFALIQRVIIPALETGRTVCHNIRGLDNVDRIADVMGLQFPETARLIYVKHDSEDGFEYMARFFQWAPPGALIVMDEGQRVYPTRLRNLSSFDTPEDARETLDNGIQRPWNVENAFDQHRHMNWDIYISTTNVDKIHREVRQVVEYAFRHRDMSGVLPWYKNKWREFKHDAESTGKQISHYIGTPKLYSADFRVFDCYKSTATGTAKSSSENKNIFADTKLRIFIAIMAFALIYFLYGATKVADRFSAPPQVFIHEVLAPDGLSDRGSNPLDIIQSPDTPDADLTAPDLLRWLQQRNPVLTLDPLVIDFPWSERWRLTGVIRGIPSVAFVDNGIRTVRLSLDQSCVFLPEIADWVCYVDGELVANFTGPIQGELQPVQVVDTIKENSLIPVHM